MSGPMQPAVNQILRMPMGQTKKPRGDDRPPGVLPPGQSTEPIQRSDYSRRILAARRLGVEPSMIEQPPGYRPGMKGNSMIPPRQAAPAPAPKPVAQSVPPEPAPEPVPLPRPRPAAANPQISHNPADYMTPVPPESVRRAQAMAEALKAQQEGRPPVRYTMGWPTTPPPTTANSPVWGKGSMPIPGTPPAAAAIPPQPQVREATPDEVQAAQKKDMARQIAATRSGGEQQTAPAARGAATPPAPSVAPSPAPPPPPETFRPITGPDSEYIVRDPAAEKERAKDAKKPQKSTYKEKAGSRPSYYEILKVPYGDNRLASQALSKLRARAEKDPSSITMEEDRLLAATNEDPVYNKSMLPEAQQKRMTARGTGESDKEETGRPKFDTTGSARPGDRMSRSVPTNEPNTTVLTYVPPIKGDPAVDMATRAIDQAGQPPTKRLPTQEDVNKNPEAYKTKADVDTDDVPEE